MFWQWKPTKCSAHSDQLFGVVVQPSCEVVDNPLIFGMIVKIATFQLGTEPLSQTIVITADKSSESSKSQK